jgi:tRNA nucleotidyltransferase (CCA-adding enzyme)
LSLQTKALPFSDFFNNTPADIAEDIHTVTQFLKKNYLVKSYIVGGAVRDYLLGRECMDFDIECYGITPEDFDIAMQELGAQGVGKSFFVYKYHQLDIALPRTEKKIGVGHKGFSVILATEEQQASRRRDFTVNALMYDLEQERILDFWGGLQDIDQKLLRVVDQNSFVEDSLRVLRAMQFAARFGFKVEEESCRLCRDISLDDLPKERIFIEFEKMFRGAYPLYGLYYLFALGIARQLWGIEIDRSTFVGLGRALTHYQKNFIETLYPYYFLYIVAPPLGIERHQLLDRIGAPGIYSKKIADTPLLPPEIDCAFVARTARKEGIAAFTGNYHPDVKRLAQKLGVWEKPFNPGVKPALLMAEGFEGKALGDELERRREERIGGLDEDCSEL